MNDDSPTLSSKQLVPRHGSANSAALCEQLHGKYRGGRAGAPVSTRDTHKTCTDEVVKYLQCVIRRPRQLQQRCCQGNAGPAARSSRVFCLAASPA